MKIAYIGKFNKMWDEEYVAQGFEKLGHNVLRIPEMRKMNIVLDAIDDFKPDFVIWAKLQVPYPQQLVKEIKKRLIPTVCWVWDLYWGYNRENQILTNPMFQADIVITSDGGNDKKWKEAGIKHFCVRQGIYDKECFAEKKSKELELVFVGSPNAFNKERQEILERLKQDYKFYWFGKSNTDDVRGTHLNKLYAKTKIVVGDSVYSPYYWSNRVVETLGRGGFLIHQEVPGLKKEYPYLVTYKKNDYEDLKSKIDYYLKNNNQREDIIKKNLLWVKENHLIEQRCNEVINYVKTSK